MGQDIDRALAGWEFKPGMIQARMVSSSDGRQVIQLRIDLGVLQMEIKGRPDGTRPNGFLTYLDYLRDLSRKQGLQSDEPFTMNEEQCIEADREFVQFYHRRVAFLTMNQFDRAIRDADHTLAFMDFVKEHALHQDYVTAHEQYRPFVLFHRTAALVESSLLKDTPENAIDSIRDGLQRIKEVFIEYEQDERYEKDPLVRELKKKLKQLRKEHGVKQTLKEQLAKAVEQEDYETAARIRDEMKKRSNSDK
ncbi:MAG TPA: UvrB/UvrC motif-containing protein [Gemmatales bacterium]|nr:UvrB/UvrC motif-containing protein [Gemmatales bacterium]